MEPGLILNLGDRNGNWSMSHTSCRKLGLITNTASGVLKFGRRVIFSAKKGLLPEVELMVFFFKIQ
jgi:hypothetical protein